MEGEDVTHFNTEVATVPKSISEKWIWIWTDVCTHGSIFHHMTPPMSPFKMLLTENEPGFAGVVPSELLLHGISKLLSYASFRVTQYLIVSLKVLNFNYLKHSYYLLKWKHLILLKQYYPYKLKNERVSENLIWYYHFIHLNICVSIGITQLSFMSYLKALKSCDSCMFRFRWSK